ncbi:MAG: hypothetical protein U0457_08750 [Candidatus Sericytochromatia bacterium]
MSNMSNIGFNIKSQNDITNIAQKVAPISKIIEVNKGAYVAYSDKSGAELWLQVNNDHDFIGFNPHFKGKSKFNVSLIEGVERKSSDLDFAFYCWASPSEIGNPDSGLYNFVFDCPDGKKYKELEYPQDIMIQLSAFARKIDIYDNEDEFYNQQEEGWKLGAQSFIPTCYDDNYPLEAYAILSGVIKEYKKLKNDLTGYQFYWFLADTYGGEVDIVADINIIKKEPQIKGVISGSFWLSGQLIEEPKTL